MDVLRFVGLTAAVLAGVIAGALLLVSLALWAVPPTGSRASR